MSTAQSMTAKFARAYARGAVPAMLKTIKEAKRDSRIIVAGVLAITYWHVASHLATVPGIGPLGYAIPLVVDLGMLRMLGIVQTIGMRRPAKIAALIMTGVAGLASAALNITGPGALMARMVFGALVVFAIGIKIVVSLIGPDFAAIGDAETQASTAAPTRPAGRRCQPGCTCRKHSRNRVSDTELANVLDGVGADVAPVSPAPFGA